MEVIRIKTRSKGISNSKRELGIEVAIRSFQVNKNHESIVLIFSKSADYLHFFKSGG